MQSLTVSICAGSDEPTNAGAGTSAQGPQPPIISCLDVARLRIAHGAGRRTHLLVDEVGRLAAMRRTRRLLPMPVPVPGEHCGSEAPFD